MTDFVDNIKLPFDIHVIAILEPGSSKLNKWLSTKWIWRLSYLEKEGVSSNNM